MSRIDAVIFDLGRVMIDLVMENDFWQTLINLWQKNKYTEIGKAWNSLYADFGCGHIAPEIFHQRMCNLLNWNLNYNAFKDEWCACFKCKPDMEKLYKEVANKVKVGILSDTDPLHWKEQLSKLAFLDLCEKPTLSFEVGAQKPHQKMYQAAAQNTGFRANKCFFVDDLPENVEGARKAGMIAEVFKDCDTLRKQLKNLGVL